MFCFQLLRFTEEDFGGEPSPSFDQRTLGFGGEKQRRPVCQGPVSVVV